MINECPAGLLTDSPASPAANHLFDINPDCAKLSSEDSDTFHHFVAKLLHLAKWT